MKEKWMETNLKRSGLLLLVIAVMMILSGGLLFASGSKEAGPAKTRLNVGFTAEMSLETTIPDENWQYLEMGCVFWPILYDQVWILGPAGDGYDVKPMLAESWEVEDDMKTWTFHLRKDAVFHDGTPVTAQDLAFTLEYLPKADSAWDLVDFMYTDFEVIDDYTFKVVMEYTFGMPYLPLYWLPVLPKHIWEDYKDDMLSYANEECIGSGPYKLKEFKPGQYVWFEANEDYWGGKPGVDEIIYKIYGSQDAMTMALANGEIDMVGYTGINPLNAKDFKDKKGMKVMTAPDMNIYWINFNLHQENGIADLEVRKAIMQAIDVDRIIKMAYVGYAVPCDSFVYPELDWYNDDITRYPFDTAKAKAILDAAGYVDTDGDGIRNEINGSGNMDYELMVPSDWTPEVKAATLVKEMLGEVGIGVELKVIDLDTYYDFVYTPDEDQFDFSFSTEGPGPNGEWFWDFCRSWDNGGAGWNTAYYNSAEFDAAMDSMLMATSLEEKNMYRKEMQKIISEDLPYGILLRRQIIDPVNTRFTGYTSSMGGISNWVNPWTYFNIKSAE